MALLQYPPFRSFVRRSGIKKLAYKVYFSINRSSQYEAGFSNALLGTIRQGDCVWDVGANIGFYTCQLAEHVGASGRVIAIEPFADSFQQLSSKTSNFPQVQSLRVALGAREQELKVSSVAPTSTTNNLWQKGDSDDGEFVSVTTGARLIEEGIPSPTVLKIDVEGFEEEVLWGFRESLRDSRCRAVFIEVHFGLLEQRGLLRAPSRVVSMLQDLGFQTRWIDRSHLAGTREAALSAPGR